MFEHVGQATFPTSVFTVKPFGKVVICAGTTGFNLDFDVRYLWMKQKQIIGSHFANAWECNKANELIENGQIRPVLWKTFGFDGVAEAHQLMRDNQHLGKISILVGAEKEGLGKTEDGPGRDHRGGRRMSEGGVAAEINWAGHPVPGRQVRGGLAAGRRGRAGLRRHRLGPVSQQRRAARLHPVRVLSNRSSTSSATGTPTS